MNKRLSVKSQYGSPLQHDLNIEIITITNNSRLFNTVKSFIIELVSLSLYKRIGKETKLNHLFVNHIIFCYRLNAVTYLNILLTSQKSHAAV